MKLWVTSDAAWEGVHDRIVTAATINNNSVAQYVPKGDGKYDQKVQGVLQEMDGLLRIHISGVNSRGERRSYVVNVEMSEPIYRAMHSYVGQFR